MLFFAESEETLAQEGSGATVARRRLGRALRKLREKANIRLEQAAEEVVCSIAKISRQENGLAPMWPSDVRLLLDLYGLTDPVRRAQLEEWAVRTGTRGVRAGRWSNPEQRHRATPAGGPL
jgi:transcriptional regulator with XRE-family HTH domain